MKTKLLAFLVLFGLTGAAMAMDPSQLEARIRSLTARFDDLQQVPTKAVPPEILRQARGIMLLDRTKAGFLFAYEGGGGIATVRDSTTGKWGPVAFVKADQASLGFQVGGEQHFVVVLFMTTNSTHILANQSISFAGEARGTAGDQSSGVQSSTPTDRPILVYDDRQGFYGGVAFKGNAVTPDDQANQVYYGQPETMADILFNHRVKRGPAADDLAHEIEHYAHNDSANTGVTAR